MAPVVKPLDGDEGYLRWKESMLLRLNTTGVPHVLSEDPPAGEDAAAKKWAREDAICRGHILATLSDRIFPDYVLGDDYFVAFMLSKKLPLDIATILIASPGDLSMDRVWHLARYMESRRITMEDELQVKAAMAEDQNPEEQKRQCWTCGKYGHLARNCRA